MTLRSAIKAVRAAFLVGIVLYAVTGVGLLGPRVQQENLKASTVALAAFSAFVQGQATRYFASHPIVPSLAAVPSVTAVPARAASPPAHKHSSHPHSLFHSHSLSRPHS